MVVCAAAQINGLAVLGGYSRSTVGCLIAASLAISGLAGEA